MLIDEIWTTFDLLGFLPTVLYERDVYVEHIRDFVLLKVVILDFVLLLVLILVSFYNYLQEECSSIQNINILYSSPLI